MKKNIPFTLLLIALLFLTACGQAVPASSPASDAADAPASTADFPVTLTDDQNRSVTLETKPQRIVSLLPSNTEILFAVGAGDQVVGVTSYCNYPKEAASREQVGGITNKSISIEAIVALEPDLILASDSHDQIVPLLEEAGLTVMVLNPATFDDIFDNVELVGRATGHAQQAETLTNELRQRLKTVESRVESAADRPTVFYEVWYDPLMTAGPNTFIGQLITLAGGENIFANVEEDWPQVSAEVVIERNPEVILGPTSHAEALTIDKINARASWEGISAIQNERIHMLDGDAVSRPGPRIVDMLEETARYLHPDLFE